jgi:hypothetical protein
MQFIEYNNAFEDGVTNCEPPLMHDMWDSETMMDDPFADEAPPALVSHNVFDDLLMMWDGDGLDDDDDSPRPGVYEDDLEMCLHDDVQPVQTSRCTPITPPSTRITYQGNLPPMVSPDVYSSRDSDNCSPVSVELQQDYDQTLEKLAASMMRSEASRQEIQRQRQQVGEQSLDFATRQESRNKVWSFIEAHQSVLM